MLLLSGNESLIHDPFHCVCNTRDENESAFMRMIAQLNITNDFLNSPFARLFFLHERRTSSGAKNKAFIVM